MRNKNTVGSIDGHAIRNECEPRQKSILSRTFPRRNTRCLSTLEGLFLASKFILIAEFANFRKIDRGTNPNEILWEINKYLSETTRPRLQIFSSIKVTDRRGVQRWLGTDQAHFRNVRTAFESLRQHGRVL